jgi:hypothetical protein
VADKERAPSFEGALPCCEVFRPRLIPAAILAALASPRGISPKVNSLSGYFFLVFLAGFFFFIFPLRMGLDLVAFLALRFITGIGTSAFLGCRWRSAHSYNEGLSPMSSTRL